MSVEPKTINCYFAAGGLQNIVMITSVCLSFCLSAYLSVCSHNS